MAKKSTIQAPKLPRQMEEVKWDAYVLEDDMLVNVSISEDVINGLSLEYGKLDGAVFSNVIFEEARFTGAEITDVIFDRCDLSNVSFEDAVIHRMVLRDCKLLGMNLSGATIRDVVMERCFADYTNFRYSKCNKLAFQECSLLEADYVDAEFAHVTYDQCRLNQANFGGVNMNGVDLSTSTFAQLTASADKLAGCVVTAEQVVAMAGIFGLVLKEDLE